MPRPPDLRLAARLVFASLGSAAAVATVCAIGIFSLRDVSTVARGAIARQIEALNDTSAFEALLYQKGFVAQYLLSRDPSLLEQLEKARRSVAAWLDKAHRGAASVHAKQLLASIEAEYRAYDGDRARTIALFLEGKEQQARALLGEVGKPMERLRALLEEFNRLGRIEAVRTLQTAERSTYRLGLLLVAASLMGVLTSLALGFFLARRVAKPIYELQLKVESAVQRMRIEVTPGEGALGVLAEHIQSLVSRLEDLDASAVEQRRRLIQSEKLSAVGELAAKLGHEILKGQAGRGLRAPAGGQGAPGQCPEARPYRGELRRARDRGLQPRARRAARPGGQEVPPAPRDRQIPDRDAQLRLHAPEVRGAR
jgi:hypothetical protein